MFNEDIPGVEVAVQISGADAREYEAPDAGDEDEACATLTKYIECIDDAFFSIRLQVHQDYDWDDMPHSMSFSVYVDGHWVGGQILEKESASSVLRGRLERVAGSDSWVLRKLQFASIKTVDDTRKERVEKDSKVAKDLGLIEVRVERGTRQGNTEYRGNVSQNNSFELSEKSMKGKALSHGTSLRSSEHTSKPRFVEIVRLAVDDGPIAKFRFLYRSREALKRETVIPRTPTPPPPAFDALSDAEMRRLARERFEETRGARVKAENARRPIKREFGEVHDLTQDDTPKRRKGKMTRLESGKKVELIELSDDDD